VGKRVKKNMKYKTQLKIAIYSILFGWIPLIVLAMTESFYSLIGLILFVIGAGSCMFGVVIMRDLLKYDELFKSIEELEEERMRFYEATKRLEKKISELKT
jgi:hypothetical protein